MQIETQINNENKIDKPFVGFASNHKMFFLVLVTFLFFSVYLFNNSAEKIEKVTPNNKSSVKVEYNL